MKFTVQMKHNITAHIEEQEEMDSLHKAIVFANPRYDCVCGNRDSHKFVYRTNKDKQGNTYIKHRCLTCGAESKLGKYKVGGYFWREFEKYVPKEDKED